MKLDQVSHYRKPQSQPSVHSREGAVGLPEAIKNKRQKLCVDAFAVVTDCYPSVRSNLVKPDFDVAATRSELDRIREQVPNNLLKPARVTRDDSCLRIERYLEPNV